MQDQYNQANKAGYLAAGQQLQNPVATKPQTQMEGTCSRLSSSVMEAERLFDRLSILECRLLGGGSAQGKDTPPRPIPTGHLGQLNSSLDDLSERLSRSAEICSRLLDAI